MFLQLKLFYKNFCEGFQARIIFILSVSLIAGLFELIGVAAIIPVLQFLINPESLNKNPFIKKFLTFFNIQNNFSAFLFILTCVILLFVAKNIYMIYHQFVVYRCLTALRNNICLKFMQRLMNSVYSFFLQKNSDSIINTVDNTARYVVTTHIYYTIQLFVYFIITFLLLGFIFYAFFLPTLIVCLSTLAFYLLQNQLVKAATNDLKKNITRCNAENVAILQQSVQAIKETKIWQAESCILKNFSQSAFKVNQLEQLSIYLQGFPSFIVETIIVVALFLFCALLTYKQGVNAQLVESLGLVAVLFFRLAPALNRLWTAVGVVKAYGGSLESLNKEYGNLLNFQKKSLNLQRKSCHFKNTLTLKDVSYSYNNSSKEILALSNINLEIRKGEFVGIVGASGSGKTTLADVLLGLLTPLKGEYLMDGEKIQTEDLEFFYHSFAYVSQFPYLGSTTIAENIAFASSKDEIDYERVIKVMKMAQLGEFDPKHFLLESGKTLSGGQRQRIAIARALYRNPKLLVLDEATSALDIPTEHEIATIIASLKGTMTIVAIAHRLSTLKSCDRIIYMDMGTIVDIGSFEQLKEKHPEFLKMVRLSNIQ